MAFYGSVSQLVGDTPLVGIKKYAAEHGAVADILIKLESFNPAGSVKDRVAKAMIEDAERYGKLKTGSVIIEPTSGNTGIGLAAVAASRGYRVVIVMPDTMSMERRAIIRAYGAEIVLTDGKKGMGGAIEEAERLHARTPGSVIAGQFVNPSNPRVHYDTTGPEIWRDTGGKVDIFVAGVGTGGTITGVGGYLKEQNGKVQVVAVEPADSPVLSGGKAGPHAIQGIGAGFVPDVLDVSVYDTVITATYDDAVKAVRALAKTEGILAGVSSGASLWAATQLATRAENKGKTIVALLPDTGERYLSSSLFA